MTVAIESMNDTTHQPLSLYRHTKCDDWGLAILAWERADRRGYQFEDGKMRVFKQGYYSLLREVNNQVDGAGELIAKLRRRAGTAVGPRNQNPAAKNAAPTQIDEQLAIFRTLYPEGFGDQEWLKKFRGKDAGRRLKRHRDAAIKEAHSLLDKSELDALIEARNFDEVFARVQKVLTNTDLVSNAQLKHLRMLGTQQYEELALALRDMLHGEQDGEYVKRLDRFIRSLTTVGRGKPSWPLATALPALMHPGQHICIRPSTFSAQTKTLAPTLRLGKNPSGHRYTHLLRMAQEVADFVQRASLTPADLMDIYDFMWTTLRPAARKLLTATLSEATSDADETSAKAA